MGHLALAGKQCVLNMYKQLLADRPGLGMAAVVLKIVEANGKIRINNYHIKYQNLITLGVAKSTVYRTVKEYRQTGEVYFLKVTSLEITIRR